MKKIIPYFVAIYFIIIISGLTIAIFFTSCNKNSKISEQKYSNQEDVVYITPDDGRIKTVVYKQHEYILYVGFNKGSLCHSESCKCKSKK